MTRNYPKNPATQPIKGVFVFHQDDGLAGKAQALFKTLYCEVITAHDNRFTVKTSRGNLQSIKKRWMDNSLDSAVSQELHASVSQIIIGGAI